jgi:hypothetical protein
MKDTPARGLVLASGPAFEQPTIPQGTTPIRSFANERECQTGKDKGRKKNRKEPLSSASVGDGLALCCLEGSSSTRVSATADLKSMTSGLDRDLDRFVHFDGPDALTVDHDIVGSSTDLRSDCLMRQL